MDSGRSTRALPRVSFLIRRSRDQRSVSTSPGLIAAAHVLHRLLAPRHPPCALVLLIRKEHVRCRYGVFKVRASFERSPYAKAAPQQGLGPSKLNSVRPALERTDTRDEVDVVLGELVHRTVSGTSSRPSTSPAASGVRAPDSLERR
jgi:hypothetical protein